MTEITQADRDAAAALSDEVNPCACEMCKGTMQEAFARHRMEERAAIVAWLRDDADQVVNADGPVSCADVIAEAIVECAQAIAEGEHLK